MTSDKSGSREKHPNGTALARGMSLGAGIGVALGAGIGVALGSVAIGAGAGVALGTAVGMMLAMRRH